MMRHLLLAALIACSAKTPDRAVPPPAASGQGSAIEVLSSTSGDGAAAVAVAARYIKAMAARDWAAACATRAKAEQAQMAELAGTCELAMAKAFEDKPVETFANATVARPRRRDGIVVVDFVLSIHDKPGPIFLAQEDHRWVLVEKDDSEAF
ncbi:MAG: hypothetical protein ABI678_02255 [Kofleriaceae bacterium]